MNEKLFAKPSLEKLKEYSEKFKAVLADAQYNSSKVRDEGEEFGGEPVTMLTVALTGVRQHNPNQIRSIKHYTT
jgi:hypothetical protein